MFSSAAHSSLSEGNKNGHEQNSKQYNYSSMLLKLGRLNYRLTLPIKFNTQTCRSNNVKVPKANNNASDTIPQFKRTFTCFSIIAEKISSSTSARLNIVRAEIADVLTVMYPVLTWRLRYNDKIQLLVCRLFNVCSRSFKPQVRGFRTVGLETIAECISMFILMAGIKVAFNSPGW